jgi:hypothetical protein
MKIKQYPFSRLQEVGDGCYGTYYHIDGTKSGTKILKDGLSFKTVTELKNSSCWSRTKKELKNLEAIYSRTDLVPRPRGMAVIKYGKGKSATYECGYVMEHIEGKTVASSYVSEEDSKTIAKLERRLKKKGVYRGDCHDGNVMRSNKKTRKFVFVDVDSWHVKDD